MDPHCAETWRECRLDSARFILPFVRDPSNRKGPIKFADALLQRGIRVVLVVLCVVPAVVLIAEPNRSDVAGSDPSLP
jgi:hypothetical protein